MPVVVLCSSIATNESALRALRLQVRLLSLACCVLSFGASLHASLNPALALSQYMHASWQTQSGLPQNSVPSIAQTPDGYIWAATEEGLARFDGLKFTSYDTQAVKVLHSNIVMCLMVDRSGVLWIGTHGGGVVTWKDGEFRAIASRALDRASITSQFEDSSGNIWIGTDGNGLYCYHNGQLKRMGEQDGLPDSALFSIGSDSHGRLWVATGKGLSYREGARFVREPLLSEFDRMAIHSLFWDREGNLWFAPAGEGLFRWDGSVVKHFNAAEGFSAKIVSAIYQDRGGTIWVGTLDNGFSRYVNEHFSSMDGKDGFGAGVWTLYEDREGTIWLGTIDAGLHSLKQGAVTPLGRTEGLPVDAALATYQSRDGALWIGSEQGVVRWLGGRATRYTLHEGLADNLVLTLVQDQAGNMWAGTRTGLARSEGKSFHRISSKALGFAGAVLSSLRDSKGHLWFGGRGVISRFDGKQFVAFGAAQGVPNNSVVCLYEDARGGLWAGTDGGGLARLENNAFRVRGEKDGLPSNSIWSIAGDQDGSLWLGSNGAGLIRMAGGKFSAVARLDGLADNIIFKILDDGHGMLWMSSNKGIFTAKKAEVLSVMGGHASHIDSRIIRNSEGMRTSECNGGFQPAGLQTTAGELIFPTQNGLAMVNRAQLGVWNSMRAPVAIERITAGHLPVGHITSDMWFPPSRRSLDFGYAVPDFSHADQITFRYKLLGFDSDWVDADTRRTASYTNVPPGAYQFTVAACLSSECSPASTTPTITMVSAAHETYWFKVGLLLLAGLAAIVAYRFRVRHLKENGEKLERLVTKRTAELLEAKDQLEERVDERTKALASANLQLKEEITIRADAEKKAGEANKAKSLFLANMSHELRTPMNGVIGMTKLALALAEDSQQRDYLQMVTESADHLLAVLNDILDFSKVEAGKVALEEIEFDLQELIGRVVRIVAHLAHDKGLAFIADWDDLPRIVKADPTRLQQVLLNLLTNAVKFTSQGEIVFGIKQPSPNQLRFSVKDTGVGIALDKQSTIMQSFIQADSSISRRYGGTGLGLAISSRLIAMMGGSLKVFSEEGHGSTFSFEASLAAIETLESNPVNAGKLVGRSVLILEQNDSARRTLRRRLEGWGMRCHDQNPASEQSIDYVIVGVPVNNSRTLEAILEPVWKAQPEAKVCALLPTSRRELSGSRDLQEVRNLSVCASPVLPAELLSALLGSKTVEPVRQASVENASQASGVQSMRVLVAEDNRVNQRLIQAILQKAGAEVTVTANGKEAIQALESQHFDAILMDIQMPVMDGLEATKAIRCMQSDKKTIPIIAVTAHALNSERDTCLEAGMDDYLTKPVNAELLLSRLAALMVACPSDSGYRAD